MSPDDSDRLESWKEIAAFLGRDERTAMRWAAQHGMPVHRVPGSKRGRVFASRSEISEWLGRRDDGNPQDKLEAPRAHSMRKSARWALAAGVLGLLVLAVLGGFFYIRESHVGRPPNVTRVTFTSEAAVAWHGDNELWKYRFPWPLISKPWSPLAKTTDFVRVLDLDHGEKRVVVLVAPLRLGFNPDSSYEYAVDCFSNGGKLIWSYVAHEKFQFGRNVLSGPWKLTALFVAEANGKRSIWVAEDHHTWGDSFVVQLNLETGEAKLRFVNTGVLTSLNEVETAAGTYMLAGGFNNEYSAGILAVVNLNRPFAASPQTGGTRHDCVSCPPGAVDEYFVFPRTRVNLAEGRYEDDIQSIRDYGDRVRIEKYEVGSGQPVSTIYQFRAAPTIHPVSMRHSSGYGMLYRHLEKEGKIHHSLAMAPERLHPPPISVWTPGDGWAEYAVAPSGMVTAEPRPIAKPPHYALSSTPSG